MYGAGAPAFSLMSYVIANMRPDNTVGFQVELNVKDLANRIGEPEATIQRAIDYLCAPDPLTRTPGEDGRRLVKIGTFDYRVVNGVAYAEIRTEEQRRERNRERQARHRAKSAKRKPTIKTVPPIGCIPDGGAAQLAAQEDRRERGET